jgi:hypothetical protein
MKLRMLNFVFLMFSSFAEGIIYLELDELPAEIRPFVEKGTSPLFFASADLNGDGLQDFVLVLERQKAKPSDPDIEDRQRPLLILVQQSDGALKEVKRNEKVVYCSTCGGLMGDPFQGVVVEPKSFTVSHYGGSAWRWSIDYVFNYSHEDKTWKLARVEQSSFHAFEPDNVKRDVDHPPKDYEKIDIADFDPDHWRQHLQKQ